jgi:hypothetical protein
MAMSHPEEREQTTAEHAEKLNKIRAELKIRASQIEEKIKRLDRATSVSSETMRLEFVI